MAGHEIVRIGAFRLSRKKLREWLEAEGPQEIDRIVIQAKLHVPAVTLEQVVRELAGNPELFELLEDNRWAARPRQRYVVVDTKPRPRPKPRARRVEAGPARAARKSKAAANRHPANPSEPLAIERGRVGCITFNSLTSGGAAPSESGRHLLVPMPQGDGPFGESVLASIQEACLATPETDVYSSRPGAKPIFRGRRPILDARRSPDGLRIHIVLGPGEDDEGRLLSLLRGGPAQLPLLPRFSGQPADSTDERNSVAVIDRATRERLGAVIELSPDARRAALLPPPRSRYNRRQANEEANRRLQEVRLDSSKWGRFQEWLSRRKAEYDQELLQDILRATLAIDGVDRLAVFRLARLLIDDAAEVRPEFACAFCEGLSERLSDEASISWAERLLPIASAARPGDPTLSLAAARIALHRGRDKDAARLFGEAFKDPALSVGAAELEEFLLASVASAEVPAARAALRLLEAALDTHTKPADLLDYRRALEYGIEAALLLGSPGDATDLLDRLLLLLLDTANESAAITQYETHAHGRQTQFRHGDRLRLLSTLARCESVALLLDVLLLASDALERAWDDLREPDRIAAVADLRHLEYLVGEVTHRYAQPFADRLATRRAGVAQPTQRDLKLRGKVIVVLGGRRSTRERVVRELRIEHGAKEVRQIPPSWEAQLDEQSVRARTENADFVVQITDCIKHDAQQIIRSVLKSGARFEHVPTQGGASRIARELLAHVGRRMDSSPA